MRDLKYHGKRVRDTRVNEKITRKTAMLGDSGAEVLNQASLIRDMISRKLEMKAGALANRIQLASGIAAMTDVFGTGVLAFLPHKASDRRYDDVE